MTAQSEERRWLPAPVLLATIEDRDGTLFASSQDIVVLPDAAFTLLDRGDNAVRAFLTDASPAWTFGRYGEGPGNYRGSFLFPNDLDGLAILSDDRLATLDLEFFPTVQLCELDLVTSSRSALNLRNRPDG